MSDFFNIVMLIAVSAGSLAFGVLAAYGVFRAAFAMMRPQEKPSAAVKAQPEVAQV